MASTSELLALLLVAGLWAVPPAAAQQTCTDGAGSLRPERFQDNGDGTVTDRETRLMWMRCSSGQDWRDGRCGGSAATYDWDAAQRQADQVSRAGDFFFNDWRVPGLRDLATITERACRNPRTSLAVFPDTPAAAFWSSTLRPGEPSGERALALSFGADGVLLARKDQRLHLRLVRTAL